MTGTEIGLGFAGIFATISAIIALWINNTPSSDEITEAEMAEHRRQYMASHEERRKRRALRNAEDERRLKGEA
jgi:hypothetical protein